MINRVVLSPIQLDQSLTVLDLRPVSSHSFSKSSPASLPSVSHAIHLNSASGVSIKRVKWSPACRSGAVWLSSDEAVSALSFANRGVVERISAHSEGVLSFAEKED